MIKRMVKGLSPVIATVLLIAIVVVTFLIVFVWFRGTIPFAIEKFGQNIEITCDEVKFSASYSSSIPREIIITNDGGVSIVDMKVKIVEEGSFRTEGLNDVVDQEWSGVGQGDVFSSESSLDLTSVTKLVFIPVLLGSSNDGKVEFICDERFGREVIL